MGKITKLLEDGDLRSIGRVSDVLILVKSQPELFPELIQAMIHADPGIRMRASDAVEKITRGNPEYLQPNKSFLLNEVMMQTQQEVRWHLAQIIPRLELTPRERSDAARYLFLLLEDSSKIVQTNALQALVDLAWEDDDLFVEVKAAVERLADSTSPAVSNRAGKLFLELDEQGDP